MDRKKISENILREKSSSPEGKNLRDLIKRESYSQHRLSSCSPLLPKCSLGRATHLLHCRYNSDTADPASDGDITAQYTSNKQLWWHCRENQGRERWKERKPETGLNETKPICQTKQEEEIGTYFWIVLLKWVTLPPPAWSCSPPPSLGSLLYFGFNYTPRTGIGTHHDLPWYRI